MTQIQKDGTAGTGESTAPAALSIADILQALAFGAWLTLWDNPEGSAESAAATSQPSATTAGQDVLTAPVPAAPAPTAPAPTAPGPTAPAPIAPAPTAPAPTHGGSDGAVAVAVGGRGVLVGVNAASRLASDTGKAKAEDDNGPCADCAARGCLPPPSNNGANNVSAWWYIVTAGKHVGVFAHWSSTAPFIVGVPSAVYFRCPTRAAAEAAFAAALKANSMRVIE